MPVFAALALVIMIVAAIGGVVVIGSLVARRTQLFAPAPPPGTADLTTEVERLRFEVGDLQSEMNNLTERLDFTEKLLSSGPPEDNAKAD